MHQIFIAIYIWSNNWTDMCYKKKCPQKCCWCEVVVVRLCPQIHLFSFYISWHGKTNYFLVSHLKPTGASANFHQFLLLPHPYCREKSTKQSENKQICCNIDRITLHLSKVTSTNKQPFLPSFTKMIKSRTKVQPAAPYITQSWDSL